jgi:hypothetical protein
VREQRAKFCYSHKSVRGCTQVALLTKLSSLTLSGNPLLFPPRDVAAGKVLNIVSVLTVCVHVCVYVCAF